MTTKRLAPEELDSLVEQAIQHGLSDRRALLLEGIPKDILAQLPLYGIPRHQLLSDVQRLSEFSFEQGMPFLEVWKSNARRVVEYGEPTNQVDQGWLVVGTIWLAGCVVALWLTYEQVPVDYLKSFKFVAFSSFAGGLVPIIYSLRSHLGPARVYRLILAIIGLVALVSLAAATAFWPRGAPEAGSIPAEPSLSLFPSDRHELGAGQAGGDPGAVSGDMTSPRGHHPTGEPRALPALSREPNAQANDTAKRQDSLSANERACEWVCEVMSTRPPTDSERPFDRPPAKSMPMSLNSAPVQSCAAFEVEVGKNASPMPNHTTTFNAGVYYLRAGGCSNGTILADFEVIDSRPGSLRFAIDLSASAGEVVELCVTKEDGTTDWRHPAWWYSDVLSIRRSCVAPD